MTHNKISKKFSWFINSKGKNNTIEDKPVEFILKFDKLKIGILSFTDNTWFFSYSEEFKSQKEILPLVNFPTVNKEYISDELWPFFVSRIPSTAQRQLSEENQATTTLLKIYGRKTIANPYQLVPVP